MSRLVNNGHDATLLTAVVGGLPDCRSFLCATAYISEGGCALLNLPQLAERSRVRIAIGRGLLEGLYPRTRDYLRQLDRVARANAGGVRFSPTGFHSKLYAIDGTTILGSIGSSNLTENGLQAWREANLVAEEQAQYGQIETEAERLWDSCVDLDTVYDEIPTKQPRVMRIGAEPDSVIEYEIEPGHPEQVLSISLVDRKGNVPASSGLNWAFGEGRPRDRHECYIRLPRAALPLAAHVFGSADRGTVFKGLTHDGKHLRMRLQGRAFKDREEAKQISTDGDNSRLGIWMIRECLGVVEDRRVTRADLDLYGRASVDFKRIGTDIDGSAVVFIDFGPG